MALVSPVAWLAALSGVICASPWAGTADEGAGKLLECSMGSYHSHLLLGWNVPDEFDKDGAVLTTSTCGLMVVLYWIKYLVLPLLGPACMLTCLVMLGGTVSGGHLDLVQPNHGVGVDSCGPFCSVLISYRLFKDLSCGDSSLFKHWMRFRWSFAGWP